MTHYDLDALQFFFEKYILKGAISDTGKNYAVVKTAFFEKFARRSELRDVI